MNAAQRVVVSIVAAMCSLEAQVALAQGPSSSVEPIDVTLLDERPVIYQFPNEFDPFHPKDLILDLTLTSLNEPGFTSVFVWSYGWTDLAGEFVTTPYEVIALAGGSTGFQLVDTYQIPFCPEQVTLQVQTTGLSAFEVHGTFTHVCVPEPSSLWLLGIGLPIMLASRWRRRPSIAG